MSSPEPELQLLDSKQLAESTYDHLRRLAAAFFQHERRDHTLSPTALAHEAYIRLAESSKLNWRDQRHFLAFAAATLRRVLVDHARARGRAKRGGGERLAVRVDADFLAAPPPHGGMCLLSLDESLTQLAALSARQSRIVELRFFGGLSMPEIAEQLGLSLRAVESDWCMARAWLSARLCDHP